MTDTSKQWIKDAAREIDQSYNTSYTDEASEEMIAQIIAEHAPKRKVDTSKQWIICDDSSTPHRNLGDCKNPKLLIAAHAPKGEVDTSKERAATEIALWFKPCDESEPGAIKAVWRRAEQSTETPPKYPQWPNMGEKSKVAEATRPVETGESK